MFKVVSQRFGGAALHCSLRIVPGRPQLLALERCFSCKLFAKHTRSVASIVAVIATQRNDTYFDSVPFEHSALVENRFGRRKVAAVVPRNVNLAKIAEQAAATLFNRLHVKVHDVLNEVRITNDPTVVAATVVVHLYLHQRHLLFRAKQDNQLQIPHFFPAGVVLIHKVPVHDGFTDWQLSFEFLKLLATSLKLLLVPFITGNITSQIPKLAPENFQPIVQPPYLLFLLGGQRQCAFQLLHHLHHCGLLLSKCVRVSLPFGVLFVQGTIVRFAFFRPSDLRSLNQVQESAVSNRLDQIFLCLFRG